MYLQSKVKLLISYNVISYLCSYPCSYPYLDLASVVTFVESFAPLRFHNRGSYLPDTIVRSRVSSDTSEASSSSSPPSCQSHHNDNWHQRFDFSILSNSSTTLLLNSRRRSLEAARAEIQFEHTAECQRSEYLFFYYKDDGSKQTQYDNEIVVNANHNVEQQLAWESFSFPHFTHNENIMIIDYNPPHPFTQQDLAKVSKVSLFTKTECTNIIQEAENLRQWRNAHSQASYAKNASTFYQIRQDTLPQTKQWLDEKLKNVIYPAVTSAFSHIPSLSNVTNLRCSAASIVKYNATAGQTSLGLHRDAPLLALTIPLNDLNEYDGGGTFIEALDFQKNSTVTTLLQHSNCDSMDYLIEEINENEFHDHGTIKRDTGYLIMHPAMLRHAGRTITHGLRYILVLWIFSTDFIALEHYSLMRANRYLAQALRIDPSSGSQYRLDLLQAAVNGYEEALEFGSADVTESALIGLGQALLEFKSVSFPYEKDKLVVPVDSAEVDRHDCKRNIKMTKDALNLFQLATIRAPSNILAWQMKEKATAMLKVDHISDASAKNSMQ